jgi:hypothetical protein
VKRKGDEKEKGIKRIGDRRKRYQNGRGVKRTKGKEKGMESKRDEKKEYER